MVYKHAVVAASAFMLSVVKLLLKGEARVCALNSHGNYIVDHGKSWKNYGIVFLNFCGNLRLRSLIDNAISTKLARAGLINTFHSGYR